MTPEEAEELFYKFYGEEYQKSCDDWSKPVVQHEVRLRAWGRFLEEVID